MQGAGRRDLLYSREKEDECFVQRFADSNVRGVRDGTQSAKLATKGARHAAHGLELGLRSQGVVLMAEGDPAPHPRLTPHVDTLITFLARRKRRTRCTGPFSSSSLLLSSLQR